MRLYGFVKANLFGDLDMVNRTDAPSVQGTPLGGSDADQQSGDMQFSARRSRIGFDTSTPTGAGALFDARVEMDFAGGTAERLRRATPPAAAAAAPGLCRRSAATSSACWSASPTACGTLAPIETLTDATFLNASAVRQAQVRLTGRLAPGWSARSRSRRPTPTTRSNGSVYYPDSSLNGGASPATNTMPDLLGRLT